MKVEIKKVVTLSGENVFRIYGDDKIIKCFCFTPDVDIESVYNEGRNYKEALKFAKKLETMDSDIEETVYTTPEN